MTTLQPSPSGTTPDRLRARLCMVSLPLIWCAVLIAYRAYLKADALPRWLVANLLLAAIPLLWSHGFERADSKKRPVLAALYFVLWLLFLPNAPYILTDIIHLAPPPTVPLWYSLALLVSCGGTGALLGYLSLNDIHHAIDKRFGVNVSNMPCRKRRSYVRA